MADAQISQPGNPPDCHVLHLSVHRYMARMPTDFGGLPDLMTPDCHVFPLIYTLLIGIGDMVYVHIYYYLHTSLKYMGTIHPPFSYGRIKCTSGSILPSF